MIRLVVYLLFIALVATGLGWLADRPGTLNIQWQGYDVETTVFQATVMLAIATAAAIFLWSVLRTIWHSPAAIGQRILRRRQKERCFFDHHAVATQSRTDARDGRQLRLDALLQKVHRK